MTPRKIATPGELTAVIREIQAGVAARTLEQIRPDPSPFATDLDIADLAASGPWPDYVEMRFRVSGTAQTFKLAVETYHGAGGSWAPE